MGPLDVAKSYDQIADHWAGDRFPRDNGIAQHERAITFTDLRGPALDIGCGSSGRLIDLLQEHGFCPEGLDISSRMLEVIAETGSVCRHLEYDQYPELHLYVICQRSVPDGE